MNRFETKYSNSARAMDEALIYLLNDKDYDYITIKEICKKLVSIDQPFIFIMKT